MLNKIGSDENLQNQNLLNDETIFHINENVNCHNCRIWVQNKYNNNNKFLRKMECHPTKVSKYKKLCEKFPGYWIGSNGTVCGQHQKNRSDPQDFLFWGYNKNIVYAEKIRDLHHLRKRITAITAIFSSGIVEQWVSMKLTR